jgi:hypothetical protein
MEKLILILFFLLFFVQPSFGALIVKYQTNPIITDQTITVVTYYDDMAIDQFYTFIYSTRNPNIQFYNVRSNAQASESCHRYAVVWITNKIMEIMLANCCNRIPDPNITNTMITYPPENFELYDIEEEDEKGIFNEKI